MHDFSTPDISLIKWVSTSRTFFLLLWKWKLKGVKQFAGSQNQKRLEHKSGLSDSRPYTLTHSVPSAPPHSPLRRPPGSLEHVGHGFQGSQQGLENLTPLEKLQAAWSLLVQSES